MFNILLSLFLIVAGIIFFYNPSLVIKICLLVKRYLLNEKLIILYSRKIGLILFLVGFLVLVSKVNHYFIKRDKYYLASREFYNKNFKNSEKICIELLSVQPKNVLVLELLGKTYFATGRYELAKNIFLKIKTLSPSKTVQMDKYLIQISSSTLTKKSK
jgi:tetratricopeptide (TPR) repeat protein